MIKTFKHQGLEQFFISNDRRLLDVKQIGRIERLLDALDSTSKIGDLLVPGYGLHKLSGNRKGTWSVKVSGNWRLTFCFEDGDVFDVNLEDYH